MNPIIIIIVLISPALALIPASIAKKKGYNFTAWWIYGWFLFIIALIHVMVIPDKNLLSNNSESISAADEIKKYKELLDQGALTQEEFDKKKKEFLNL